MRIIIALTRTRCGSFLTRTLCELDADCIGYDGKGGYSYATREGDAAGKSYSFVSIVDTARKEKVDDVLLEAPGLEAILT